MIKEAQSTSDKKTREITPTWLQDAYRSGDFNRLQPPFFRAPGPFWLLWVGPTFS